MAGPSDADNRFLGEACRLAVESAAGDGGPFGAVVVHDATVIATGTNRVTAEHDPTAHAEVGALRRAAARLGTHDLSGCTLYASCHPCPMCMTAAWWAGVDRVVYAASPHDAAAAGFGDERFWSEVADPGGAEVPPEHLGHPDAVAPFRAWAANTARRPY